MKTNTIGSFEHKLIVAVLLLLLCLSAAPAEISAQAACTQSQVVINEIYTEGGLTGASYRNDYVELYNTTGAACNLTNFSIQVATGNANNFPNVFAFPSGSIIPGAGFYLIGFGSGGAVGALLPTPDFAAATDLSSSGKVALVNSPASLTGNCASNLLNAADFVGYGITNCFLGAGAAAPATPTQSAHRTSNGANTRNNNVDFVPTLASPRNTLSPTAAGVLVAGRVTANGFPVRNAQVYLTDFLGGTISSRSNSFGYFSFIDVPAGAAYLLTASAKGYRFESQFLSVVDDVTTVTIEASGNRFRLNF